MKNVSLFIPCTVDLFLPRVGEAVVSLLRRLGVNPTYHPEQTCCGQPAMNAGYRDEARRIAKHFISVFGKDEIVVSPSGSCVCMVKQHYPEILEGEPEWRRRAEELAPRVYEFSQYLVDVLKTEDVGAAFKGKVAYHESCHILRGLGVSDQPKKLIARVKGAELVPMTLADSCCGFGGEFANEFPDISEAMLKDKVATYVASGADLLLLCEPGCLLNIGGYLHRNHPGKNAMHLATFLATNGTETEYGNQD
ncbi:MAG TPA: (Fe-S)-binding protein [Thermodesulfobacteriota bacterium]|nr:(Fe-S)-binding protein [Thermodesulfobacteriota bacterium]